MNRFRCKFIENKKCAIELSQRAHWCRNFWNKMHNNSLRRRSHWQCRHTITITIVIYNLRILYRLKPFALSINIPLIEVSKCVHKMFFIKSISALFCSFSDCTWSKQKPLIPFHILACINFLFCIWFLVGFCHAQNKASILWRFMKNGSVISGNYASSKIKATLS